MSRLGASVHLLTSTGAAGRVGATVSSVCSVSDNPPTLLVCLNRTAKVNQIVKTNGVFSINTLIHDHTELSNVFAGQGELPMDERFAKGNWISLATGSPILNSARVSFDCQIKEVSEVGTHSVIFGEVVAARLGEVAPALIYLDRNYHSV
ncbi:NADH:FAD oxidoreductase [Pseudovibrio axinellae]|uniref:NADH:FAD oxidoreductase n=1 Tax=Pseudovibrio axinellae TaxID=989403 RepID=A0A166ALZ4_9HYPH|nr:flavin reductase [Pseudovibrio axinellae]KZL21292.1 NADH:FAD oxidoreductase [Pseudovibrio axinellae]SEQ95028.1 flavin reductase [Pseudovibrio axinellae]